MAPVARPPCAKAVRLRHTGRWAPEREATGQEAPSGVVGHGQPGAGDHPALDSRLRRAGFRGVRPGEEA